MTTAKIPALDQYWEGLAANLPSFSPEEQSVAVTHEPSDSEEQCDEHRDRCVDREQRLGRLWHRQSRVRDGDGDDGVDHDSAPSTTMGTPTAQRTLDSRATSAIGP